MKQYMLQVQYALSKGDRLWCPQVQASERVPLWFTTVVWKSGKWEPLTSKSMGVAHHISAEAQGECTWCCFLCCFLLVVLTTVTLCFLQTKSTHKTTQKSCCTLKYSPSHPIEKNAHFESRCYSGFHVTQMTADPGFKATER